MRHPLLYSLFALMLAQKVAADGFDFDALFADNRQGDVNNTDVESALEGPDEDMYDLNMTEGKQVEVEEKEGVMVVEFHSVFSCSFTL